MYILQTLQPPRECACSAFLFRPNSRSLRNLSGTSRILFLELPVPPHSNAQIAQVARLKLIHEPVNWDVPLFPFALDNLALPEVLNLHSDVRLGEGGQVTLRIPRELREGCEPAFEGRELCEPVFGSSPGFDRGLSLHFDSLLMGVCDSTTVGVPDHEDVVDLEGLDAVGEHRYGIVVVEVELAVWKTKGRTREDTVISVWRRGIVYPILDSLCDIAMDKDVTGTGMGDFSL